MNKLLLNKDQRDRLSEFLANFTLVIIASILTPFLTGVMLKSNLVITGIGLIIISLIASLYLIS